VSHTTGDGIITVLRVLTAVKKEQRPLSELAQVMTVFPQKLINVEVKDKPELSTIPEISQVIKDIEEQLADTGTVWFGTQEPSLCAALWCLRTKIQRNTVNRLLMCSGKNSADLTSIF